MPEFTPPKKGQRLPPVALGEVVAGAPHRVLLENLLTGRKAVGFGVAGAFTPVCSQRHVPDFGAQADNLKAQGFDPIVCICPKDPFTMEAWARSVDPQGGLRFLSDCNREFAHRTGLIEYNTEYFLGETLKRFVMIVEDAVVRHIGIETNILSLSCSRAADVTLAA